MTRFTRSILCVTALFFAAVYSVSASVIPLGSDCKLLAIDLPEGFYLTSKNEDANGKTLQLQNSLLPVTAVIKIYKKDIFKSAAEAMSDNIKRLKAQSDTDTFKWRNQDFTFSIYTSGKGRYGTTGYAASVIIPETEETLFLLVYTQQSMQESCSNLMLSFIDGLCIDYGSYYEAGPVTVFLNPDSENFTEVSMNIDGKDIKSFIRESDREASDFLISREYKVLELYAGSSEWQEAWKRYYRMVFRDSVKRLNRVSFDIFNTLNPCCADDTDLAQKLMTWTQGMEYEREKTSSDFTSMPAILQGEGCDCDSRCMLLSVLLRSMNMDSIMFVSSVYSHAVAGFVSTHPGHSFKADSKDYLIGETTVKGLTWGMIAQEQDNPENWIPVLFY